MREEQQKLWDDYKAWLMACVQGRVSMVAEEARVELRTDYAVGIVEIHDLDMAVVELSVTNPRATARRLPTAPARLLPRPAADKE